MPKVVNFGISASSANLSTFDGAALLPNSDRSDNLRNMTIAWPSEKAWKLALNRARSEVRRLENMELPVGAKIISDARRRAERILAQGLPEWQQKDDPRHLPLP